MSKDGIYRGEALRAVAMPLGGLGTGTIALAGDGSLRQWQIHNQVNHLGMIPHSFFAIWSRGHRPPAPMVARVLQTAALHDLEGPAVPPTANDHVVPAAQRELLQTLPGVRGIEYEGRYPIAGLRYLDDDLPVQVSLEAFNPFVPTNSRDSGIPAVCFTFTVTNPNDRVMLASLMGTLQNAVGWDGVQPITGTSCGDYGGNLNAMVRLDGQTGIVMSNPWLKPLDPGNGSMALMVDAPDATYTTGWNDPEALWADFTGDGRLTPGGSSGPTPRGETTNGALAVRMKLQPGETRTIHFTLSWHFPNRTVNWSQRPFFNFPDEKSTFWLGNQYNNWFGSALDVAAHINRERDRLTELTRLARDTFYDTSLPFHLIDTVTAQMSVARTPTCFWTADGNFFGFEGCNGISTWHTEPWGGSCPLNCTHVWNYEMSLARLYPDLERTMRDTEWHHQQHATGYLPHRVLMPLYLQPIWDKPMGGPRNPALDGLLGAILKTYRDFLANGDREWLDRAWPRMKLALDHLWSEHDPERSGMIEGEQPNTYDISIYGANTFIGTLYLASLRVMEEVARLVGDGVLAEECRRVFLLGREANETLWNGEFYIQRVDLAKHPEQNWGIGCHTDQLLGQWWAHRLGLGYLLDPARVRGAAEAILRHNFRSGFAGFEQTPRIYCADGDEGVLLCTWPNGGRPEIPTQYSDEVWTGMEYELAALLLEEGDLDGPMKILSAVRARYDGVRENPWNDIECGDHYARAMSSWTLLEAASGFQYDASRGFIQIAPAVNPADYRAPFVTRDGWGRASQRVEGGRQTVCFDLRYGVLELSEIRVRSQVSGRVVEATVGGSAVSVAVAGEGDRLDIAFESAVHLTAGMTLSLTIS